MSRKAGPNIGGKLGTRLPARSTAELSAPSVHDVNRVSIKSLRAKTGGAYAAKGTKTKGGVK